MSLTSHLGTRSSPVRSFMDDHFPASRELVRLTNRSLRELPVIRPSEAVSWGTVGMAIDYRVRLYLKPVVCSELVAYHGAQLCHSGARVAFGRPAGLLGSAAARRPEEEWVKAFFGSLEERLRVLSPIGRRLDADAEDEINRYCYVLAFFEQVFRSGMTIWDTAQDFSWPDEADPVQRFLKLVPDAAVADLRELSWTFFDRSPHLFASERVGDGIVCNPTFEGSVTVGGADADLIVGPRLIDIKTSTKASIGRPELLQLIGYALLDTDDAFHIREVGFYLTRRAVWVHWSLDGLLAVLAGEIPAEVLVAVPDMAWAGTPHSAWRERFGEVLDALARAQFVRFVSRSADQVPPRFERMHEEYAACQAIAAGLRAGGRRAEARFNRRVRPYIAIAEVIRWASLRVEARPYIAIAAVIRQAGRRLRRERLQRAREARPYVAIGKVIRQAGRKIEERQRRALGPTWTRPRGQGKVACSACSRPMNTGWLVEPVGIVCDRCHRDGEMGRPDLVSS